MRCLHCKHNWAVRPRGLCNRCYTFHEIRLKYPCLDQGYRSPMVSYNGCGRLAKEPTHAKPGTSAKLEVMTERAARGETLFHPRDAMMGVN